MVYLAELSVCVTIWLKIVKIYARHVPLVHRQKRYRRRRYWLIAASTIDWSNCAHSSIRRVLSLSTSTILER